jgi:glycosyltransferase involved in cell wall biosynthesis
VSSIEPELLVAVITRTKDRPLLLERAAQSVLGQGFSNFIWVIVNDGGDVAAVESQVERHRHDAAGRIRLIHNPRSLGMQSAANVGITESASTYVVIHDDDDTWDPRFLECTTARLEQTGAMGVATSTDLITERIECEKITTLETSRMFPGMRAISVYRMCYENQFAPISFLFRREVFDAIGYFDQSLRGYGDWDFHLRFLERYDIDYLDAPDALAFYHQRPDATGDQQNSVFIDDQRVLADKMLNKWLRADLERGRLGLGYVVNSLRNGPVDGRAAVNAILARIDEQADQLAQTLSEQVEEHLGVLSHTVVESSKRLEANMSRQHQGLVPVSHRMIRRLKHLFFSRAGE